MSLFAQRYREMSRRSTIAFWAVMVSAGIGLTTTASRHWSGYQSVGLETLGGACTFVMFLSLGVLCIGRIQENRHRTR